MVDPSATQIGREGAEESFEDLPAPPGYQILAEMGRGGMGVVYRAKNLADGRPVALKLIRNGILAGPQQRARFRFEAEAAAGLRHPNVIAVHSVGVHQGVPYFAMELIEGGSLDRLTAGRPQSPASAARLIRTLALGVQHAHDFKIVHRDLKPANVLLALPAESGGTGTKEGAEGTEARGDLDRCIPKIADFGLAKRLDAENTALTKDGAILGTASYMAPEQAAGRVSEIGPAADIYSLGAILYELLSGRPPFRADSWNRTVEQVLSDEPVPPSRWEKEIPRDLETICLKCLEKDPLGRYSSAAELASDLERFLDGHAVVAIPLSDEERLRRLAARDGFRLIAEIGRGPGSVVHRALHGPLQQTVAVKLFSTARGDVEWEARFRRGVESWSVLSHPQVVLPQQSGSWDGRRYVVLDYAANGSLSALASGKRLPLRQIVSIGAQLAEIVGYLHRQGVVHGNLKCANVLLAAGGIPRITDFHPTGGWAGSGFSADGSAGDPTFVGALAPECLSDPAPEPGLGADVYGMGVILYELLTGRPPLTGATVAEVIERVRNDSPPPPSTLVRDVPPALENAILRCLAKKPARRFARVYELQTRLERLLGELESPEPRRPHVR